FRCIFCGLCRFSHYTQLEGITCSFQKRCFIPALFGISVISVILIIGESMYPPVDTVIINKIIKSPIKNAFLALDVDYSEAVKRLEKNGISMDGATTIESIWINNNSDPEEVIDLIITQK